MTMILEIDVTALDIKEGAIGRCRYCPVARAMRRATALPHIGITDVMAGSDELLMYDSNGTQFVAVTPPEIVKFISDFDNRRGVSPFKLAVKFTEQAQDK